jgi:hypothetical protein
MAEPDAHHRALAKFAAEHRDQLETYADSNKETAWLADAVLQQSSVGCRDKQCGGTHR